MLVVAALGGNAFIRRGESLDAQWRNVRAAAEGVAELVRRGYSVVVTHGNGPQVGAIMEWVQRLGERGVTLDVAVAMTQGWLGYMLQQAVGNALEERGLPRRVATVVTQVQVSRSDPAWARPSKPIGPYYTPGEAERLSSMYGWAMRPDPRGGYRRVVPSPRPQGIVELEAVKSLVEAGYTVIAVGGGGVPVVRSNHWLHGVEAVVDKDLASALLAENLGAGLLAILTDVPGAYVNYGRPGQRLIRCMTPGAARRLLARGEFPAGSMGPKVEAAAGFVEKTGGEAVIASLDSMVEAVDGGAGTLVRPGCPGGRSLVLE